MATVAYTSGDSATYYFVVRQGNQIWNGTTFETEATANWGNYDISMTETPANSGRHLGTFPSGISAGEYEICVYEQLGGSPAYTDAPQGQENVHWDGTSLALDKLASDGLDEITPGDPSDAADSASSLTKMIRWIFLRLWSKATMTATQQKVYKSDASTLLSTQTLSDDQTTQTQEKAS